MEQEQAMEGQDTESPVEDSAQPNELERLIEEGSALDKEIAALEADTPLDDEPSDIDDLLNSAQANLFDARQKARKESQEADLAATVATLSDGSPFDEETTKAWILHKGKTDPRLLDAFLHRKTDPATWNSALSGLSHEFKQKAENIPDSNINEDRAAVVAAAKGRANGDEPDELTLKQLRALPKDKWNELQAKAGVKPYGV